jgi:AcrR family transcriptional regulator
MTPQGLPGGFTVTSPEIVDEIQRRRIFDSLAAVTAERGYAATTIERILSHAHMAPLTFSAFFDGKDDCFLAACRSFADRLGVELDAAWQAEQSWPAKVRAAIAAALAFAAEQPAAARLLAVEVQAGPPEARAAQVESVDRLAAKLREGRRLCPEAAGLNPSTEPVVVGGIVALIGNRLVDGQPLEGLGPQLVEFALAPYLGAGRARRLARS